jgi:hypothetical protein
MFSQETFTKLLIAWKNIATLGTAVKKKTLASFVFLLLSLSMIHFVSLTTANLYVDEYVFNDILSPAGT